MHEHAPAEGLDKHAGHHTEDFLRKFWVVATFSIPVILYSSILDTLFGWSAPAFPYSAYLPLALGSIILDLFQKPLTPPTHSYRYPQLN